MAMAISLLQCGQIQGFNVTLRLSPSLFFVYDAHTCFAAASVAPRSGILFQVVICLRIVSLNKNDLWTLLWFVIWIWIWSRRISWLRFSILFGCNIVIIVIFIIIILMITAVILTSTRMNGCYHAHHSTLSLIHHRDVQVGRHSFLLTGVVPSPQLSAYLCLLVPLFFCLPGMCCLHLGRPDLLTISGLLGSLFSSSTRTRFVPSDTIRNGLLTAS